MKSITRFLALLLALLLSLSALFACGEGGSESGKGGGASEGGSENGGSENGDNEFNAGDLFG